VKDRRNIEMARTSLTCTEYAQDIEPRGDIEPERYICYRAADTLTIDGKMDEPSWEKAPWTPYFVDIEGDLKPRPWFKTRAKMLWDDEYFYVAADMEEPDLWATVTQRDVVIYVDHDFEVFIDPDGDTHNYYELEMNAFNTVWDLFLAKARGGGPSITAWDIAGLRAAVNLRGTLNQNTDVDDGWSVELAFPWRVLREAAYRPCPPEQGDQWRVNFSRVERHIEKVESAYERKEGVPEENWVWSPQGLINMHYPEMWGYVQFSTTVVGEGEDEFIVHPEEEAKRALFKIYYSQQGYYKEHGRYTDRLEELVEGEPALTSHNWPPRIQVTDSMFEASIEGVDQDGQKERWHIRQDSKVWRAPE